MFKYQLILQYQLQYLNGNEGTVCVMVNFITNWFVSFIYKLAAWQVILRMLTIDGYIIFILHMILPQQFISLNHKDTSGLLPGYNFLQQKYPFVIYFLTYRHKITKMYLNNIEYIDPGGINSQK